MKFKFLDEVKKNVCGWDEVSDAIEYTVYNRIKERLAY
jgi:hypothetical protein